MHTIPIHEYKYIYVNNIPYTIKHMLCINHFTIYSSSRRTREIEISYTSIITITQTIESILSTCSILYSVLYSTLIFDKPIAVCMVVVDSQIVCLVQKFKSFSFIYSALTRFFSAQICWSKINAVHNTQPSKYEYYLIGAK